jgi:hypothetical protein
MRKLLLTFLLFEAVNALAQPTISGEISSGPIPSEVFSTLVPAPAVALAKDRMGIAIAWAMGGVDGDRISVVRLDATGHFTGDVRTIRAASPDTPYLIAPSLAAAPHGYGFTLVWAETSGSASITRVAYCSLDRDLKPSAPVVMVSQPNRAAGPAIVRSGKTTWISAGASAWQLRDDGSLSDPLNAGMTATDMTVATAVPQIVAAGHFPAGFLCPPGCAGVGRLPFCMCPLVPVTKYSLEFTSLYNITASKIFDFESDAAPAVGNDGRDVAIVWFQAAHDKGGAVVMSRLSPPAFTEFPTAVNQFQIIGSFGIDSGPTRPDIASDGQRYVVVWRTTTGGGHDVVGASIDHFGNVIPLSIATSAADERDPSVIAIGGGVFLVAYDKIVDGGRQIAGRFVTFETRGRAIR